MSAIMLNMAGEVVSHFSEPPRDDHNVSNTAFSSILGRTESSNSKDSGSHKSSSTRVKLSNKVLSMLANDLSGNEKAPAKKPGLRRNGRSRDASANTLSLQRRNNDTPMGWGGMSSPEFDRSTRKLLGDTTGIATTHNDHHHHDDAAAHDCPHCGNTTTSITSTSKPHKRTRGGAVSLFSKLLKKATEYKDKLPAATSYGEFQGQHGYYQRRASTTSITSTSTPPTEQYPGDSNSTMMTSSHHSGPDLLGHHNKVSRTKKAPLPEDLLDHPNSTHTSPSKQRQSTSTRGRSRGRSPVKQQQQQQHHTWQQPPSPQLEQSYLQLTELLSPMETVKKSPRALSPKRSVGLGELTPATTSPRKATRHEFLLKEGLLPLSSPDQQKALTNTPAGVEAPPTLIVCASSPELTSPKRRTRESSSSQNHHRSKHNNNTNGQKDLLSPRKKGSSSHNRTSNRGGELSSSRHQSTTKSTEESIRSSRNRNGSSGDLKVASTTTTTTTTEEELKNLIQSSSRNRNGSSGDLKTSDSSSRRNSHGSSGDLKTSSSSSTSRRNHHHHHHHRTSRGDELGSSRHRNNSTGSGSGDFKDSRSRNELGSSRHRNNSTGSGSGEFKDSRNRNELSSSRHRNNSSGSGSGELKDSRNRNGSSGDLNASSTSTRQYRSSSGGTREELKKSPRRTSSAGKLTAYSSSNNKTRESNTNNETSSSSSRRGSGSSGPNQATTSSSSSRHRSRKSHHGSSQRSSKRTSRSPPPRRTLGRRSSSMLDLRSGHNPLASPRKSAMKPRNHFGNMSQMVNRSLNNLDLATAEETMTTPSKQVTFALSTDGPIVLPNAPIVQADEDKVEHDVSYKEERKINTLLDDEPMKDDTRNHGKTNSPEEADDASNDGKDEKVEALQPAQPGEAHSKQGGGVANDTKEKVEPPKERVSKEEDDDKLTSRSTSNNPSSDTTGTKALKEGNNTSKIVIATFEPTTGAKTTTTTTAKLTLSDEAALDDTSSTGSCIIEPMATEDNISYLLQDDDMSDLTMNNRLQEKRDKEAARHRRRGKKQARQQQHETALDDASTGSHGSCIIELMATEDKTSLLLQDDDMSDLTMNNRLQEKKDKESARHRRRGKKQTRHQQQQALRRQDDADGNASVNSLDLLSTTDDIPRVLEFALSNSDPCLLSEEKPQVSSSSSSRKRLSRQGKKELSSSKGKEETADKVNVVSGNTEHGVQTEVVEDKGNLAKDESNHPRLKDEPTEGVDVVNMESKRLVATDRVDVIAEQDPKRHENDVNVVRKESSGTKVEPGAEVDAVSNELSTKRDAKAEPIDTASAAREKSQHIVKEEIAIEKAVDIVKKNIEAARNPTNQTAVPKQITIANDDEAAKILGQEDGSILSNDELKADAKAEASNWINKSADLTEFAESIPR